MDEPQRRPSAIRLSPQIFVLLLGLLLWAIAPSPRLWTLVAGYGAAWLILNVVWRRARGLEIPLSVTQAVVVGAVVIAAPLAALYRQRYDVSFEEGFRGLGQNLADRVRLETLPSIAPAVLFTDHPQSLYVAAPGASQIGLSWDGGPDLEAQSLGEGLFRVVYDPRRHGAPTDELASTSVALTVDGKTVRRELGVVRPEAHPRWFASDPDRGRAATVSEETDEVFLLSRDGLERHFTVGDGPTDCAFFDQGRRLAVSHRYSADLWIVDPATGDVVSKLPLGPFQARLAVSPDETLLAVAQDGLEPGVRLVNVPTKGDGWGEASNFVSLEFPPDGIVFGTDSRQLLVSSAVTRSLYKLHREQESWDLVGTIYLGRPAVTMARAAGGKRLYLAATDYRPGGEDHRGNHFIQDQILTVDTASFRVTDQYLTARRSSRQVNAGSIDRGASPMGIVVRRDGTLLVAFAGTDEVWELDAGMAQPPKMFWGLDLDLLAPHGVADLGDGYWAASSPAGGSMAVFTRGGEMVTYLGVTPTNDELASGPDGSLARQALAHRRGESAFYEATRSGISCQSCHLHGTTDHSPHDIGQTPVLHTLTARGVARTSPYLRDASFPRVRDLNTHLAQTLYRGYLRYDADRGTTLESYVEGLSGHVNPRLFEARDLERERRGVAAFVKAECTLCHAFPALTNLGLHPVRTLFPEYGADLSPTVGLDTPSLLGVHAKAHFLHDGRAETLADVLDQHNTSNRHGNVAVLSEDERRSLVHFLASL